MKLTESSKTLQSWTYIQWEVLLKSSRCLFIPKYKTHWLLVSTFTKMTLFQIIIGPVVKLPKIFFQVLFLTNHTVFEVLSTCFELFILLLCVTYFFSSGYPSSFSCFPGFLALTNFVSPKISPTIIILSTNLSQG